MKSFRSKRGAIALIVFVVFAFAVVYLRQNEKLQLNIIPVEPVVIKEDFKNLNRELWYVGEWLTNEPAYDRIELAGEMIALPVNEDDKGPFIISRPIEMKDYDMITIKRRVKIHPGSDYFAGGLAVFQTESSVMMPGMDIVKPYGTPVVLVEYAYDHGIDTKRPGKENIRLLAPNWEAEHNYGLLPPIFDEWFTEELIIDGKQKKAFYTVNNRTIEVKTEGITQPYFRLLMHSFGAFTGHNITIDNIEITLSMSEAEVVESETVDE